MAFDYSRSHMRIRIVLGIASHVTFFVGLSMLVPLCVSLYYQEGDAAPIAWSMAWANGTCPLIRPETFE